MSSNIWGYQGVNTPLESLTQGRYNVADYTEMRAEFGARIQALENAGGFVPTNVNITGYLNIVPGSSGYGYLTTTGYANIAGAVTIGGLATFSNDVVLGNNLTVSGLASLQNVDIANVNAGDISADNLTVTNVLEAQTLDITATSTFGGNITLTSPAKIIGDGSLLTGVIAATATNALACSGNSATATNVNYAGLTGTVPTWNQNTTGNALTATTANDPNKLPLSGGTLTGALNMGANAINSTGSITASSFSGSGALLTGITAMFPSTFISVDQTAGQNYTPPANNTKYTTVLFQYTNSCTLNLANFAVDLAVFPDGARYFSVIKGSNAILPFTVTIVAPAGYAGYTFYSPSGTAAYTPYSMGTGTFSLTLVIWRNGSTPPSTERIYVTGIS